MLLFVGSTGSHINELITLINENSPAFIAKKYNEWDTCTTPKGIVYIKVMTEIALKRSQNDLLQESISLEDIQQIAAEHALEILELNGNRDFRTDFSQFYNHLFYIKKFYQDMKKKEDMQKGTYIEKPKRKCCGC